MCIIKAETTEVDKIIKNLKYAYFIVLKLQYFIILQPQNERTG